MSGFRVNAIGPKMGQFTKTATSANKSWYIAGDFAFVKGEYYKGTSLASLGSYDFPTSPDVSSANTGIVITTRDEDCQNVQEKVTKTFTSTVEAETVFPTADEHSIGSKRTDSKLTDVTTSP